MFLFDYYFGSLFIVFFIIVLFIMHVIQLFKIKSLYLNDIYKYIHRSYVFELQNKGLIYYSQKPGFSILLLDWLAYISGIALFAFLLLLIMMLQSLLYGCFFLDAMYSCLILVNACGGLFMLFSFILFFFFFLVLRFISYMRSFIIFEFFFFFICVFWGIYMVLSVFDLISIYIFVELQGVCFYVLASLYKQSFRTVDSGIKYFILGSLASVCLLCGFFLLYAYTGLFTLVDLYAYCNCCFSYYWLYAALCFVAISFLFKLMVFPFHFWALDVYEGSSYIVTFFFLVFSKVSFFYLIWLFFSVVFSCLFCYFKFLFLLSAAFSILYSTVLCCVQVNIKRFFICSSYNHIGFILAALGCNTFIGLWSFFFYICVYMLMTFLLWALLNILNCCKSGDFIYLSDFSGLFYSYFYISLLFIIVLFSMAGLPPFLGFFAKFYVIVSLVNSSYMGFSFLFLLLSVISAFYYIRVLKYIFIDKTRDIIAFSNIWFSTAFVLFFFGGLLSFFLYYSDLVFEFANFLCYFFCLLGEIW